VANLPLVSTTPTPHLATGTAGVVDTCGKFATSASNTGSKFTAGVNDTGGVANNGNNIRLLAP
jgi:hypothetical protein